MIRSSRPVALGANSSSGTRPPCAVVMTTSGQRRSPRRSLSTVTLKRSAVALAPAALALGQHRGLGVSALEPTDQPDDRLLVLAMPVRPRRAMALPAQQLRPRAVEKTARACDTCARSEPTSPRAAAAATARSRAATTPGAPPPPPWPSRTETARATPAPPCPARVCSRSEPALRTNPGSRPPHDSTTHSPSSLPLACPLPPVPAGSRSARPRTLSPERSRPPDHQLTLGPARLPHAAR
jgi:hypothetical protein